MSCRDEIDHAFARGGSPYTGADFFKWLREGRASMYIGQHLRGGMVFWKGEAEVAFVAGEWEDEEARTMWAWAESEAEARGFERIEIRGRPGWRRFLRMKGAKI